MNNFGLRIRVLCVVIFTTGTLCAQESLMDEETKSLLDSLDQRALLIEAQLPPLLKNKSPKWFYKKRELDYTLFLRHYHKYLFEEELDEAERLVDSRLEGAKKRGDQDAIKFYLSYQSSIARERINHQRHYQELFAKEKNFRKEFMVFLKEGNIYGIQRATRMTDLAIKYAWEKKLKDVLTYLYYYRDLAEATREDLESSYDLRKLTSSEKKFMNTFTPLVESDSIQNIKEAEHLLDLCNNYSKLARTEVDSNFFAHQLKIVKTSISDYYDREGNFEDLAALEGQSIIARSDSLNREGIYKWHDMILVIGNFRPEGKFSSVQRGEAVIQADKRLINYMRINRIAKSGKAVKIGAATLIPYHGSDTGSPFQFNPELKKYQYMVCYQMVENQTVTKDIIKLLPPLLFEQETESL